MSTKFEDKLKRAKSKYSKKKYQYKVSDYDATFEEFILDCFLDHSPSAYGKYIQKEIVSHLKHSGIYYNIQKQNDKNEGDFKLVYPGEERQSVKVLFEGEELIFNVHVPEKLQKQLTYEVKSSFLGKNDGYTIRNIRPYHDINGGYVVCLIDCENDFQPEFYVLSEKFLFSNFNMSHMNGTNEIHKDSKFENYGVSFKRDSFEHDEMKRNNELSGTDLKDLVEYIKNKNNVLESEFNSEGNFKRYIDESKVMRDPVWRYKLFPNPNFQIT